MIAYTREKLEHLLKVEFVRFCIVGGLGFVINLIILKGLQHIGNSIWVAQLIGAEIALGSNFILHHNWTYKSHRVKKSIGSLLVQFHATSWPAILGSTAMVGIGVNVLHLNSFIALLISSLIALFWNFVWSKFVIWRDVTPAEIDEIVK